MNNEEKNEKGKNNIIGGHTVKSDLNKNNKNIPIIAIAAVVIVCFILILIFLIGGSKKENGNGSGKGNGSSNPTATEFLALANKYVAAVEKLWDEDSMVCQDAKTSEMLKPSELSSEDKYEGIAYYYVFINTADSSEMKLDVDDQTKVAGWVRISKADKSFYVALSDGKNYIVDKGTEQGIASFALTESDVVTTGNGANYQYMNGEIFGSSTDGNYWGIGDYKVMTDEDSTNDGIYMTNGPKTGGYTPYCNNA